MQSLKSEDVIIMQKTARSSPTIEKGGTTAVDHSSHSFFFRLPLEVRMEVYSYVFTKAILHVEAVHPYQVEENGVMIFSEPGMSNDQKQVLGQWERGRQARRGEIDPPLQKSVGQFLPLGMGGSSSGQFTMYRCTSDKSFEFASACPPGYCDHFDCGKTREGAAHAFPSTCRRAYSETSDHVRAFKLDSALQFSSLKDLEAFSMLLSADQRENIRDIRLNLDFDSGRPTNRWQEWYYFCNVFATPWDRRSIQHEFDGSDYPNHKAKITFHYNYSPTDLALQDPAKALASWVQPNINLEWESHGSSWGTATDLWRLRARAPLSVRFAIPQFLARTRDGQIDYLDESTWDEQSNSVLRPGDEGHVRFVERYFTESMEVGDLLLLRRKIATSVNIEEKEELQNLYDEKLRQYWHEPHFEQPNWGPGWLRPLRQCQHFESFDVDFYDEDGPRSSLALKILRDGMKERFTGVGIARTRFCSTLIEQRRTWYSRTPVSTLHLLSNEGA